MQFHRFRQSGRTIKDWTAQNRQDLTDVLVEAQRLDAAAMGELETALRTSPPAPA